MAQHPYSASVPGNEQPDLQQSLFPSWHNRRHSRTTDTILEEGERKSGSFEALQNMVQKQQQEDKKKDVQVTAKKKENNSTASEPDIVAHESATAPKDINEKKPKIRRSVRFTAEEDDGSNFIKN